MKTLILTLFFFTVLNCKSQIDKDQKNSTHVINLDGEFGNQGLSYSTVGNRTINRNGENGYNGESGTNGSDGMAFIGHIWIVNDSIKVKIENIENKKIHLFTFSEVDSLIVSICGGEGGNGGEGENGFDGLNGTERTLKNGDIKTTPSGNGGNGGNGGEGGNGGSGGTISIYLDLSAEFLKSKINIINLGGQGGKGGNAGKGGDSGLPLPQQVMRQNGEIGKNGLEGKTGQNGIPSIIKVVDLNKLN